MDKEAALRRVEQRRRVLDSPAGLKGLRPFFGDGNGEAEIGFIGQKILYHRGKMVDIHHKGIAAMRG